MDRWRLGLWDRDAGYVRSLGRYIRERAGERLEVRVFTSEDALRMCLDEGGLEGVLAGDAVLSVCREYPGLWTALLAEREEEVSEEAFPVIGMASIMIGVFSALKPTSSLALDIISSKSFLALSVP